MKQVIKCALILSSRCTYTGRASNLTEDQIDVGELEAVLRELFSKNKNILQEETPAVKTNIRRLIMIYDYLKWGKKKEPSD